MWTREIDALGLLPVLAPGGEAAGPGGAISLAFHAVEEPEPGERWAGAFNALWPAYRGWYLSQGESERPDLATCRRMLEKWMPELVPTFGRLVELAGGDPLAARFLSLYGPPGFVVGCSQAAFTGTGGPALIRNYDYPASRLEGIIYSTSWTGRRVIGMSDCLWGLLDGINESGLAASLTFGGRPAVGAGFGVPLVITREQRLRELIHDPEMSATRLQQAFLEPPLYRSEFDSGVGTLYTAAYHPVGGSVDYLWREESCAFSFVQFPEGIHTARYPVTVRSGPVAE
jgi:Acyl-coenzyme A:6-aminopenicillanic acid acyl-transferase